MIQFIPPQNVILHHYIINHVKYSYNVILKEIHKLNDYH